MLHTMTVTPTSSSAQHSTPSLITDSGSDLQVLSLDSVSIGSSRDTFYSESNSALQKPAAENNLIKLIPTHDAGDDDDDSTGSASESGSGSGSGSLSACSASENRKSAETSDEKLAAAQLRIRRRVEGEGVWIFVYSFSRLFPSVVPTPT